MLRPLISLAFIGGSLWFAFSVKLGGRTFAEHIDRIGQTPEAHDLVEGTRATFNPVLQEATDRMLGEHIEAPTRAEARPIASGKPTAPGKPAVQGKSPAQGKPAASGKPPAQGKPAAPGKPGAATHAAAARSEPRPRVSSPERGKLPGRE